MVGVQVRDEHGVGLARDRVGRLGQVDERVAAVVGGVGDGRPRAGGVEHRVDEQAAPGELDEQGRVADQPQPHGLHRICTGCAPGVHVPLAHSAPWAAR